MTDPITDMFVRIKNAHAVGKKTVVIPFSNIKQEIAQTLKKTGFIDGFDKKGRGVNKRIEISLSYKDSLPLISDFKRKSKPSQRHYAGWREIYPVKSGFGIGIFSTSGGIMSGEEARKKRLGGEYLVEIW